MLARRPLPGCAAALQTLAAGRVLHAGVIVFFHDTPRLTSHTRQPVLADLIRLCSDGRVKVCGKQTKRCHGSVAVKI